MRTFVEPMLDQHTQLKILRGAPEDYRGERWATGDYSGRLGEEGPLPDLPTNSPR